MPCATCKHADEHGWWGPDHIGTHCRGCHRSWTGKREAHCLTCHEHFSTPANFDAHLTSHGCRNPWLVKTRTGRKLMKPVQRASGRVWVGSGEYPSEAA